MRTQVLDAACSHLLNSNTKLTSAISNSEGRLVAVSRIACSMFEPCKCLLDMVEIAVNLSCPGVTCCNTCCFLTYA